MLLIVTVLGFAKMKVRIKELRLEKGMSQSELADAIGIARPYLSQLERGDRQLNDKISAKIGSALSVEADDLVDRGAHGYEAEATLLDAFRSLDVDQQDVWMDMARAALRRRK